MVASLLGLRLRAYGNRIARPRSGVEVLALLIGLGLVIGAVVGLLAFGRVATETTAELRSAAFIVLGSLVVVGFWLLPFAFRVDDDMPPRAFTNFDLAPSRLAAGLLLARVLSVPVALLIVMLVVQVSAWRASEVAAWFSVAGGVLLLAACVIGGQVASAVAGRGFAWRNVAGLLVLIAIAIGAPLATVLATLDWSATGVTLLRRAADVLAWTPFGVAWGAPGAAQAGDLPLAWGRIIAALLIVGVLAALWYWIVRRAGKTVPRAERARRDAGLGVFEVLPPVPGGVVAARSIVYWMRDPRYAVPLLILPLLPIVVAFAFGLAGIPQNVIAWLCLPVISLLIGWSVHNDTAADGTAFWLHVVTGVGGRADRWGRIVAPLIIGAVVVVGGAWITAALVEGTEIVLPLIALSTCTLLVGIGVGSTASALAPYPTVAPGDGPFSQPQAMRGGETMKQVGSLVVVLVLCAPTIVLLAMSRMFDPSLSGLALLVGFGSGVLVLVAGVELGAVAYRRRAPEILAFTQQN